MYRKIDALHFHWPEWLWDANRGAGVDALLKLQVVLVAAGVVGIKRVWTVHNLDIHESNGWRDRWGQRLLAHYCELLIVHSEATAAEVRRRLEPRGRVIVMPHGSYGDHYPAPRSRTSVLTDFELDESRPVLSCVGRLRDYKGLDLACEAAERLGNSVQVIIAGMPHPGFDVGQLERYADRLSNLTLVPRKLDDQEFVDLLSVSDVALLPYKQITGSGALMAAWTHGCGVVASDLDYFRETVPSGTDAGMLFESGSAESLARAVQEYLAIPHARRRNAAYAMAREYSWDACVKTVGEVFQSWMRAQDKLVLV